MWSLRVFGGQAVTLTEDTERYDQIQITKKGWEAVEPGRAKSAQSLREAFITSRDPAADADLAPAADARVLTAEQRGAREAQQIAALKDFKQAREAVAAAHEAETANRPALLRAQLAACAAGRQGSGRLQGALELRQQFRQKLLDEEAARRAEQEAAAAAAQAESPTKGKSGKKK